MNFLDSIVRKRKSFITRAKIFTQYNQFKTNLHSITHATIRECLNFHYEGGAVNRNGTRNFPR